MSVAKATHGDELDMARFITAQCAASAFEGCVLYGFDVIRTRLQNKSNGSNLLKSTFQEVHSLVSARGGSISSLYRGFVWSTCTSVPIEAINRYSYFSLGRTENRVAPFFAGMAAEGLASLVWVPCDTVTQRLQVSDHPVRAREVVRTLYNSTGIRGFYRAYPLAVVMYPCISGIWWTIYEYVRRKTGDSTFTAAIVSGVATSTIFNSSEVVKTRMQTGVLGYVESGGSRTLVSSTGMNMWSVFRTIAAQKNGWRVLAFSGLLPSMCRSAMEGVVYAYAFENIIRFARVQPPADVK